MDKKLFLSLIDKAKTYIELQKQGKDRPKDMPQFEFFYLFSNEDLSYFFSKLNLKGKDVLTVGSSGDQVLYSHAGGAEKITHFDVNPFSEFYYDYKVACIEELEFREFKKFFNKRKYPALSPSLYSKVRHRIPLRSQIFWDEMYRAGYGTNDAKLHRDDSGDIPYTKDDYNNIRKSLLMGRPKVKFITASMVDVADKLKPSDKYDYVFLSNIYQYINNWGVENPKEEFKIAVNKLANHTRNRGAIQIGYTWDEASTNAYFMAKDLGYSAVSTIEVPRLHEGAVMYRPHARKNNKNRSRSTSSLEYYDVV